MGKDEKPVEAMDTKFAVFDEKYCLDKKITLIVKEKAFSISGDDFDIEDTDGNKYFKVKGSALSIKDKKVLYDNDKKAVLSIEDKLLSLSDKINIYQGTNGSKFAVVSPDSNHFNTKSFVSFPLRNVKNEYLEMVFDVIGNECCIYYGSINTGKLICRIKRKFNAKLVIASADDYSVEIAPNVDIALMVALAICFDEDRND